MKSLLLLLTVCRLAVAANVAAAPVVIVDNACPSKGTLETAIQSLKNLTMDVTSKIWTLPQCGDGLWYQIMGINMSTADSQCPDGWVEENEGEVRACGRGTVGPSCQSTFLNRDHQMEYTKICGRAIGYQYGNTDAFGGQSSQPKTIDQFYVDGLSITYGSPRRHIWTYAAGVREAPLNSHVRSNCPCANPPGFPAPSYIGSNWYCESGNPDPIDPSPPNLLVNDPLWDGENCEGTCCSKGKSPPWFSVELPAPTDDYVEARICSNEHSDTKEDTFIEIFEIYIQ